MADTHEYEYEYESDSDYTTPSETGRRGKWRFVLALVVFGLGLVIWLAPTIVAHTSLLDRLVSAMVPELRGRLTLGSASLGWFSPVTLRDVAVNDRADEKLLRVSQISTERTLLALLVEPLNVGRIEIRQPELRIVLDSDGHSNLEEVLQPWLDQMDEEQSEPVHCLLEVSNGTVQVLPENGDTWALSNVAMSLGMAPDSSQWVDLKLSGMESPDRSPGTLSVELSCEHPRQGSKMGDGKFRFVCGQLPLDPLRPIVSRLVDGGRVSGRLQADIQCSWSNTQGCRTFTLKAARPLNR